MQITNEIKYVGVNDHKIDLFEGQFIVPNGMSYNSYVILDDKIAVMDSVDQNFGDEWISNIKNIIGNKSPDFLVVHHMEMDHSANIAKFMETFPNAKIVSSKLAFVMMKNYFGTDFENRQIVVAEGSTLELGKHTLNFVAAPNVHWPEVIMSYESSEKVLFSADGFGKFGALDVEEEWACEARRYYFGIVGKFGDAVQAVLKKLAGIEVKVICPLHGPVLTENLDYYINLYDTWSSYSVESEGVFIAYTSVYGNTKKAVEKFAEILKAKGCPKVAVADLAREDMAECVEDAFKYGKIVLATTTYTNDIFPFMKDFIHHLTGRNYQNRTIGLIENGTWNPLAAKVMTKMFENSKNITFCPTVVTIKTAMNDETVNGLEKLAEEIL
ncbi:MAG: FprA family A-type flavoprotein [Spirochaetaceae bacterium]|nr:FprA family A-type flavoprotein [Spirochaetaceae bacterium]MBQ7906324.1 FprA family A-type flavoprotein [Spirochaetaceae bacterium]